MSNLRITDLDFRINGKKRYIDFIGIINSENGIPMITVNYRSKYPVSKKSAAWYFQLFKQL